METKIAHRSAEHFRHIFRSSIFLLALSLGLLLAGCQDVAAPTQPAAPPTPSPLAFTPLESLLGSAPAQQTITTAGYIVVDSAGAVLVDGLTFADDGTPQLFANDTVQIWLSADAATAVKSALQGAGHLRYAAVVARGRLEGPGAYGSSGAYHYQLANARVESLAAQETSVADLLDHSASYEGRLVRLTGGLLAHDTSALLIDHLGAGGVPEPKARQLKLRAPLRDLALLKRLKGAASGAIRFGQVQVEGFWRGGVLIPLSIVIVT